MFYITLMNKKGVKFTKKYDSYYIYNKNLIKYTHAKNLTIISYGEE